MKIIIFIALLPIVRLYATEYSNTTKVMKLAQKGERIVTILCEKSKLPKVSGSITEMMKNIKSSKACASLSQSKLQAVAYYMRKGSTQKVINEFHVPKEVKCPVCGMFVSKYPKWSAMMKIGSKEYFFDGVKDMIKYYIFDEDFPYERKNITTIWVSDYYTLETIDAKEAFYVLDSDIFGPMGHELIPFVSKKSAQTFLEEHHGKKIVKFDEITDTMVMALDGIVQ